MSLTHVNITAPGVALSRADGPLIAYLVQFQGRMSDQTWDDEEALVNRAYLIMAPCKASARAIAARKAGRLGLYTLRMVARRA